MASSPVATSVNEDVYVSFRNPSSRTCVPVVSQAGAGSGRPVVRTCRGPGAHGDTRYVGARRDRSGSGTDGGCPSPTGPGRCGARRTAYAIRHVSYGRGEKIVGCDCWEGTALRTHVPYLLAVASTVATRRVDERLAAYGLTVRQYGLLAQLSLEPELTMAELARQLGIARQSVHQLVSELVRAGHVRRRPGADDRSRRLEITDTAHYLLTRIDGPLERAETELLGALAPDEAETLRSLLQRVLAHATDDEAWLPAR
ncbi:winged helix-turn-helix transcriptional regulator [Streptomyces halstedii]|uniref:Winged helix-turn-helix transcriptional regulator n=1 Tax=Streptomyces halstedii TaxID=1944 RepID=A0A6N9TXF7_STRHA|nr:MarR family winged helix-turn-helix transcriptional regulator [Streptomyces halstedii]NEA16190.1 winged helix-turn-helix transcriptional regulator [Streptomyces halstedii]